MERDEFMKLYRDKDTLNALTDDDRVEIFLTVLPHSGLITEALIDELFGDYGVSDLAVWSSE